MDKLRIGEVIKTLRRSKSITQEQLANFMGVSTPAVSKWEKGISYPDITILPILANYFEVTIDELLNYKNELSKEEIVKIIKECEVLISKELIEEAIELCEKYIKNYSSNYKLKIQLISVYTLSYFSIKDSNKKDEVINRSIEILEEISENSKDMETKETALVQLSSQYMIIDRLDKSEEAIKKIYNPSVNPNIMLPIIYMQQGKIERSIKLTQENLAKSLGEAISSCMGLAIAYYNYKEDMKEEDIDFDKAIRYYNLALDIISNVCENSINHSLYLNIAHVYLKQGKLEESLEFIKKMMVFIRKRNMNEGIVIKQVWCFDKLDNQQDSIKMEYYKTIITYLQEEFKELEGNEEFKGIIKELIVLSEENKINK
ncbi:MAG: helix-turn-helix transcriptional regulator [Romboutsia sp.]